MAENAEQLVVLLEAKVNDFEKNMKKALASANDNFGGIEDRGRRAGKRLEADLKSSVARSNTALGKLGQGVTLNLAALGARAGGALTAALGVNELKNYADGWTSAKNKIAAAGEATENVASRQSELTDMAIRSRSALEPIVDLYTGLRRSTEELGASQAQVLLVTETVAKGFAVSGTAASTSAGAIIQLNQALGSGKLSGDELNSVLEGAPIIARLIAKEFGVGVGELKKLAEAGKLTSEKVFGAILKGAPSIQAEFAKTNATVAQSFTNLSTAFARYIGEADQATGASTRVAGGIQAIGDHIDVVAPAAGVLAATLLGLFAGGPLGAGIAGTTAALGLFGDKIRPIGADIATLGDYGRAAFTLIQEGATAVGPQVAAAFQRAAELATAALSTVGEGDALPRLLEAVKMTLNTVIGAFVAAAETIRATWNTLGFAIADGIVAAMNAVVATVQAAVNKVVGAVNSISSAVNAGGAKVGIEVGLGQIPNVDLGKVTSKYDGAGKAAGEAYGKAFGALSKDYVGGAIDAGAKGLDALRTKANQAAAQRLLNSPVKQGLDNGSLDQKLKPKPAAKDDKAEGGKDGAEKKDELEKEIEAIGKRTRAFDNERAAIGKSAIEVAKAEASFRLLEAAKKANIPVTDELRGKVDTLSTAYAAAKVRLDEAHAAQRAVEERQRFLGEALSDSVSDLLVEGRSLSDVFNGLAKSLAKAAIQAALLGTGPFGGGQASGSGLGGLLGGLLKAGTGTGGATGGVDVGLKFLTLASGGHVAGPGTSRSDSIPAALSDGEFVMNAASTKKHRRLLEVLNAGGDVRHLAQGGPASISAPSLPKAGTAGGAPGSSSMVTIAPQITVQTNGGGTPATNADLAAQFGRTIENQMRGIVSDEMRRALRPMGLLNRP